MCIRDSGGGQRGSPRRISGERRKNVRSFRRYESAGDVLMAGYHVPPLEGLVEKFESLPGIGHKSAQRLAYHILDLSKGEAESFATVSYTHLPLPTLFFTSLRIT